MTSMSLFLNSAPSQTPIVSYLIQIYSAPVVSYGPDTDLQYTYIELP
jgi:hypothetical protein